MAGLGGQPIEGIRCRRGGVWVRLPWRSERWEVSVCAPQPVERSILPELQRMVAAEIARYRLSGLCSPEELDLMVALWQDGKSLRAYARQLGRKPGSIGYMIERLKHRCWRFYRWWTLKHRTRRRCWCA